MPPNTVYVGRPTIWGNPFPVNDFLQNDLLYLLGTRDDTKTMVKKVNAIRKRNGVYLTLMDSLTMYETMVKYCYLDKSRDNQWRIDINKLRGKNLACWCPLDQPCHADILLEIANKK